MYWMAPQPSKFLQRSSKLSKVPAISGRKPIKKKKVYVRLHCLDGNHPFKVMVPKTDLKKVLQKDENDVNYLVYDNGQRYPCLISREGSKKTITKSMGSGRESDLELDSRFIKL